jgi:predicted N-acetyltransferase YhbS
MGTKQICIFEREMTTEEFERMKAGFDEFTHENGVKKQSSDRYSFVALRDEIFVGCVSGLAYKSGDNFSGWFYLTDLFVEEAYRSQGLGAQLLKKLEKRIRKIGVRNIWTWTAGYEAPGFYQKQGYELFAEFENWYSDGSSRVGFRKKLLEQFTGQV